MRLGILDLLLDLLRDLGFFFSVVITLEVLLFLSDTRRPSLVSNCNYMPRGNYSGNRKNRVIRDFLIQCLELVRLG